jgi:hypothetical protein
MVHARVSVESESSGILRLISDFSFGDLWRSRDSLNITNDCVPRRAACTARA